MKKKLTNIEARMILDGLNDISGLEIEIPVTIGFRILQNIQSFTTAVTPYAKELDRIIGLYSKDGISINKDDDPVKYEKATKLVRELEIIEIEVEIEPLEMDDLKNFKVPMKDMMALKFITKEDSDKDDTEK